MVNVLEVVVVRREQLGANISLFLHSVPTNMTWKQQLAILAIVYFFKCIVLWSIGDYIALEWQVVPASGL